MVCQGCHGPSPGPVCRRCRAEFRTPPEKILPGGIRLLTAFEHRGAPARMVHDLKYRGHRLYAEMVAEVLAGRVPVAPLVPVPRAWGRLFRFGVDPAAQIAVEISRLTGAPVIETLARPIHTPRRAGGDHTTAPHPYRARVGVTPVVVVDDVVTTGATLIAAITAVGPGRVLMAIAANDATSRSTLAPDDS